MTGLGKLFKYTDTIWSDPREHDLMKEMFKEICKEFHQEEINVHNQSLNDTHTLSVEGTQRTNKEPFNPDREKLSLLQIGQAVLENSQVDFDRLEADIIQKLYIHLLEKGTLGNLKDLLIFMNYSRDCSLTV
jgi:hypothetical protein